MATPIETRYEHIVLQDGNAPWIANTTMKVVELVTAQQAHGWSPEELAFQFPYLTLGQIHSALAYYWDHQTELDEEMARRLALADDLRLSGRTSPEWLTEAMRRRDDVRSGRVRSIPGEEGLQTVRDILRRSDALS